MQYLAALPVIAFLALVVTFFLRSRTAQRSTPARLTWLASGVGTLALVFSGLVFPIEFIDGLMGGTNLNNLAQNLLTLVAFALVAHGLSLQARRNIAKFLWLSVAVIGFVMVVFFFLIERSTTSPDFIVDHSTQKPLWVYASVYMAGIAAISFYLAAEVWSTTRTLNAVFLSFGGVLAGFGSASEVIFLTAQAWNIWEPSSRLIWGLLFAPTFYSGVAFIALGIILAYRAGVRWNREWEEVVTKLEILLKKHGQTLPVSPNLKNQDHAAAVAYLYQLVILSNDFMQQLQREDKREAQAVVSEAEMLLSAQLDEAQITIDAISPNRKASSNDQTTSGARQ